MRILLTAGPTHEPIDPVRYIGNRSSGKMGSALATASIVAGHQTTIIFGPSSVVTPLTVRRINVETAAQMHQAVLDEFPNHDLLIMAAAVADYSPKAISPEKLGRAGSMSIELEPTADIIADASAHKRADQRTVAFSLESEGNIERARQKMKNKRVDLMVFNPVRTMNSDEIQPVLLYPDGREVPLSISAKEAFAAELIARAVALF